MLKGTRLDRIFLDGGKRFSYKKWELITVHFYLKPKISILFLFKLID